MNTPPENATRVPAPRLRAGIVALMTAVGLEASKAELLAGLLVANDLRGVVSHGSRQAATYAGLIAEGRLNGRPQVQRVTEQEATATFDGDGGLGYFPAYDAAHWVIEPARHYGVAAALTRNHGHFGAAGIYTRVAAEAGLIGYDTSGHQLLLEPGQGQIQAAGGSPMSWAIPAGEEPPLVLDVGAIHDLYSISMERQRYMLEHLPSTLYRSFGMGAVCQVLGGFLGGVPLRTERSDRVWAGANQGSFMVFVDPARFIDPAVLRRELDDYHRLLAELVPFGGSGRATLPGRLEWERERAWATQGVPVGARHRAELAEVAAEFGLELPF